MRSFKSNENIHKKEDGSYYVVSANKASSNSFFLSYWFFLLPFITHVNFVSRILKGDLNLYDVLRKQITSMTLSTRFQI